MATQSAGSANQAGCAASDPVSTSMLVPTALYCNARYGTPAVSAMTATRAPSAGLLPNRDDRRSPIEVMLCARATETRRTRNGVPNRKTSAGPR